MKKRVLLALLLGVGIVLAAYWELISYGIGQARGQLAVVWGAKPIEELLEDPNFPDSLKARLRLIQEVRQYAVDSLGINDSDNYTTMYDQKGEDLLWNVTAAEPFALVPYRWKFPFLGSFSYKGYFDRDKAEKERARLESAGYDTRIGPVSGWSTLGWFQDPVLSNMLERSEGDLADLIIHELTHGTLYVRDSVEFNENLATFVGRCGAIRFLTYKYGKDSWQLVGFVNLEKDNEKIYRHCLTGARKLDSLYQTMDDNMLISAKKLAKEGMIRQIMQSLDTLTFAVRKPAEWKAENPLPNNTFFMSYLRYRGNLGVFEEEMEGQFGGDLRSYIQHLKKTWPSL